MDRMPSQDARPDCLLERMMEPTVDLVNGGTLDLPVDQSLVEAIDLLQIDVFELDVTHSGYEVQVDQAFVIMTYLVEYSRCHRIKI
jgi:hypothetical protein